MGSIFLFLRFTVEQIPLTHQMHSTRLSLTYMPWLLLSLRLSLSIRAFLVALLELVSQTLVLLEPVTPFSRKPLG